MATAMEDARKSIDRISGANNTNNVNNTSEGMSGATGQPTTSVSGIRPIGIPRELMPYKEDPNKFDNSTLRSRELSKKEEQLNTSISGIAEVPKAIDIPTPKHPTIPTIQTPVIHDVQTVTPTVTDTQQQTTDQTKKDGYTVEEFKGERGIDTGQLEKLANERFKQQQTLIQEQAAVDQQNIKNLFSHLTATGKDSGFINSMNLAASRSANKTARDELFRHNTSFMNEMYNIAKIKAEQDAEFNEEAYTNWAQAGNDIMQQLAETGDFDGLAEVANQYAELDDNYNFTKWKNPAYVESFKKSYDLASRDDHNMIMDADGGILDIALSAEIGGDSYARTIDTIVSKINASPLGVTEMVNTIGSIGEEEYVGLGVSNDNQKILREFKSGERDISDPLVQKAYADLLIRDQQADNKRQYNNAVLGEAKKYFEGNPTAVSIIDAIINDAGGIISWEDPIDGIDINSFSVFGRDVDLSENPALLESIPGMDVYLRDVNNRPYTKDWTKEDADKQPVEGLPHNQGVYTNLYQQYMQKKGNEYEKASPREKENFRVLNLDQFLDKIREGSIDVFKPNEAMNIIDGLDPDGTLGGYKIEDLEVNPSDLGRYREDYEAIIKSDVNSAGISATKMKAILAEAAQKDDYEASALVLDLIDKGKMIDLPSLSADGRNDFFNDTSSPLYGDKGIDFVRSLGEDSEGIISIGGVPYSVKAEPDRYKPGSKTWRPVIKYTFTPLDSEGTTFTGTGSYPPDIQSEFFGGTEDWGSEDRGKAIDRSRKLFSYIKGTYDKEAAKREEEEKRQKLVEEFRKTSRNFGRMR